MAARLTRSGKKKLENALFRKGLELESEIKRRAPVFTGSYKASWETQVKDGKVIVGTPQGEKGKALEYGGEPGTFPPVDELRKWVRRKLGVDDDRVDSVAYLVGRKIKQEGIRPQPHVRPAIRDLQRGSQK